MSNRISLMVAAGLLTAAVAAPVMAQDTTAPAKPVASWVAPADQSAFPAYSTITLKANASEVGGTITNVLFHNPTNGRIYCATSVAPYQCNWTNVAPGTYPVRVLAIDANNKGGGSPVITINVTGSGTSGGGTTGPTLYTLTVNGGSGGGQYAAGTSVTVTAGAAPAGQVFNGWTGNAPVADSTASQTTLTMPAASVQTTATFVTPAPVPQPVTGHPRLWVTQNDLLRLQQWAVPSNPVYANGLQPVLQRAVTIYQTQFFPGGQPNVNYPDPGDTQGYTGYLTEQYGFILAFNALIDPNASNRILYAQYARNLLMYAMNQAVLPHAAGVPFRDPMFAVYNRANGQGEMWPLIVDWIYNATDQQGNPILTPADKRTIRDVFMLWANDCLNAYTTGGDHPAPIGVVNSPRLLPGGKAYRMAANNYYLGHARLLTMMALAIDPADDPSVNPSLPNAAPGNSLRSFIKNANGAWLYQEYAMFGEPAAVAQSYNLSSSAGLGVANGGMPPEGSLYGHSYAYMLGQLLALQTAGFADPALSGPQVALVNAPVWDRFVKGFMATMTPAPKVEAAIPWVGPVFQFHSYGDTLRLWVTPDFMQPFALLALLEQQAGQNTHADVARWFAKNAAGGPASGFYQRMVQPWSYTETVLYFLLFDPSAPAGTDPRPSLPTAFSDAAQGRLLARTDWSPNASTFDFRSSWESINHQQADAGQFEMYRKGEWLTKEISNYDNNGLGQSSVYHNTLSLKNTVTNAAGVPSNLQWWEANEWATGSQFALGAAAGDPMTQTSAGAGYAYAHSDMTRLYNRPNLWAPADAAISVTHASRSVLWFGADFVAVYDRAASPAGLFKRFNLNFATPPALTTTANGLVARETLASGQQLFVQTLAPLGATASVQDGVAKLTSVAETDTMRYIMTVQDPSSPATVRFLHVLQGADQGAAMVPAQVVHSTSGAVYDGAIVGGTAAFFVYDTTTPVVTTTLAVPTGVNTAYVTGLAPNATYSINVAGSAGGTTLQVSVSATGAAADAAGVLKISW